MIRLVSSVIGRILLSSIFIIAGLSKLLHWEPSISYLIDACAKGHIIYNSSIVDVALTTISDHAQVFMVLATICELLGGCLVLLGLFTRFGSLLLILFLIPTTFIFHAFWGMEGAQAEIELSAFMKNLAITGGLLVVYAFGSGFSGIGRKSISDD